MNENKYMLMYVKFSPNQQCIASGFPRELYPLQQLLLSSTKQRTSSGMSCKEKLLVVQQNGASCRHGF
jgi:hypothetical protein